MASSTRPAPPARPGKESRRTYDERVAIVAEGVARAQKEGGVSPAGDPVALAAELVAVQQGIVFLGRAGMNLGQLRSVAASLAERLVPPTAVT